MSKYKNVAISKKLYRSIMLVFLICVMLVVLIMFIFIRSYLFREEQVDAEDIANNAAVRVKAVFSEAEKLCDIVGRHYDVQEIIRSPAPKSLRQNAKQRTEINGKIGLQTQNYTTNIANIGLFVDDGRCFKYGEFSYREDDFHNSEWYNTLLNTNKMTWLGIYETSQALHSLEWRCFVGGVNLINMRDKSVRGVILTEIAFSKIEELIAQDARGGVYIGLIDSVSGETLYGCGESGSLTAGAKGSARINDALTVIAMINSGGILDEYAIAMLLISVFAVLASLLMMKLCSNNLNKSIARPIEKLLYYVNKFSDADRYEKVDIDTDIAEISRLIGGVEDLFERIRLLIENREKEQKIIRRAQVAALQEQINPHFLYNTMDSISWLIRTNMREKALSTLNSFATLFRLSLNNGRNFVTLEEELTYIRHYIDIFNVRYNNQISYKIDVADESLLSSYLPKLVLQPLVENCIEHGIGMRDSQSGTITITIERADNGVLIKLLDDGMGMEPQTLDHINALLDSAQTTGAKSYGIFNVNNRFRMAYGASYGIRFESESGAYTLVSLRAPICNVKGEIVID